MKDSLERFGKLETGGLPPDGFRNTKCTDRLKEGGKEVEVSILDLIIRAQQENAPSGASFSLLCYFCGSENPPVLEACSHCGKSLVKPLTGTDATGEKPMRKCTVCGALNPEGRRACWGCGRDSMLGPNDQPKINSENVIVVRVDGVEYKSIDRDIPLDIQVLMGVIRRRGYSRKLVEEWVRRKAGIDERRNSQAMVKDMVKPSNKLLPDGMSLQDYVLVFLILLFLFIFIRLIT
jgi:hypothetical protein